MLSINIKNLSLNQTNILPEYATLGSAGMDLFANIETNLTIKSKERMLVPTGIALALPLGFEAQVRPRSGLAFKHGITILNSPGTIDSDYRGEIKVLLINHSDQDFIIEPLMRIAQLVIAKYERVNWQLVDNLDDTIRGEGGFGSTGQ